MPVARFVYAPGPIFARDCRSIVVYLRDFGVRPFGRTALPGGTCAVFPQVSFGVVFVADCVPVPDDSGPSVVLPSAQAITDWSQAFGNDVADIFDAVLGWTPPGGDCSKMTVSDGRPNGPSGTFAEMEWGVTVAGA